MTAIVIPPELQQAFAQVRAAIQQMPEEDRMRIEAMAASIRNIMKNGGHHAALAYALVGVEGVTQ